MAQINSDGLKLDNEISEFLKFKTNFDGTAEKREQLIELMRRKQKCGVEFILTIGGEHLGANVDDVSFNQSDIDSALALLQTVVAEIGASCNLLSTKKVDKKYFAASVLVRNEAEVSDFHEVRIAVIGNVDSGKSTLLGVLTHCELDNGRGLARQKLFRHKHEQESGRTSSVGNDILGFDHKGNIVNQASLHGNNMNWSKICQESAKVITFIDLAGHERYLKTTIFGMTGHAPDFACLMIASNNGIVGMTKEHLGLTLALNIPIFVVITKIDMCPPNVLKNTLTNLKKILKSSSVRKVPIQIEGDSDVVVAATNFVSGRLCPIFQVSNVVGTNLDFLRHFLNLLNSRQPRFDQEPKEFQIDDIYQVPGVGTVVSGLTLKGKIQVNDTLMMGPNSLGHFIPATIKSIQRKRLPVKEVASGQTASFALKKIKRNEVRKGMIMLDSSISPTAYWEFEGQIVILHHPTTITLRYQAMVHCGSVRQTAQIVQMDRTYLRNGDKAMVRFRFIKNPEYLYPGLRIIFREGRTKAIGIVTQVFSGKGPDATHLISKSAKRAQYSSGQVPT